MNDLSLTTILVEDVSGLHSIPLEANLLSKRKIFIADEITYTLATNIIAQLLYLMEDTSKEIDIYISSPGGSVTAGLAIYDTIQALKDHVTINCYGYGMVASMAAILLLSAPNRFLCPTSKLLLHEPLLSNGVSGSCSNINNTAEKILETKKQLCGIIAKHCNKNLKVIETLLAGGVDVIMTAKEALDYELIDVIQTPFDKR